MRSIERNLAAVLIVALCACGSSNSAPPSTFRASSGVAQKGPLISGSLVTAQELDPMLSPMGKQYTFQVDSDLGTFTPDATFTSPFIGLFGVGYYFDEVRGATSDGTIALNGYSDVGVDRVLNVNLLTTLAHRRIRTLVAHDGMSFSAARALAETEVLRTLGLPEALAASSFGTWDLGRSATQDRVLAAISAMFAYGRSAGELSLLIAKVQQDVAVHGAITDPATRAALAASARALHPGAIASYLTKRYAGTGVTYSGTDIRDWLDSDGDGLIGRSEFLVRPATEASRLELPSFITSACVGTELSTAEGRLFVDGTLAEGPVVLTTAAALTVAPPPGFSTGVATVYVQSGGTRIARVSFVGHGWWSAEPMLHPRSEHRATSLPDGTVLVTGGWTGGSASAGEAEIYDPESNLWSSAGRTLEARRYHNATLLANGKVLISGGYVLAEGSLGETATAEIYDPASRTWSPAQSMSPRQRGEWCAATLLPTGRVLVVGEYAADNVEVYDPATNTWSSGPPMHAGRLGFSATRLEDGRVLIVGGGDAPLPVAEIYDAATNEWVASALSVTRRERHAATLLQNGKVLVTGGWERGRFVTLATADLFDPVAGSWSPAAPMGAPRKEHSATLLPNGNVLVASDGTAEIYDPVAGTWTPTSATAPPHHGAAAPLPGGVLVVGGDGPNASAHVYW